MPDLQWKNDAARTSAPPPPEEELACEDDLLGNAFLTALTLGEDAVCEAGQEDPLWTLDQRLGGERASWSEEEPLVCEQPASALPQYDVVPDDFKGPLGPNQLRQAEADRRRALTPTDAEARAQQDPAYIRRLQLAQELIKIGGSGDLSDGRLVVEQLVDMPVEALEAMREAGTRVVACRDAITDYRTDLKGVRPRGWPPGSTWDTVPGVNTPDRNEVVIATRGHGSTEGAHVPRQGEGHGSYNLVIHESMHAVDMNNRGGAANRSESADFLAARAADASVGNDPYLAQAGEAGHQETYAEIAARYYGHDPTLAAQMPNLNAYFAGNPLAKRSPTP